MPTILLTTFIQAPVQVVFDLSRSIDFHAASMQHTTEKAVAGKTSGLIGLHETVTWQARHFGKMRLLQVQITAMEPHTSFTDEMLTGNFKTMTHQHLFAHHAGGTLMKDIFDFETPYGLIGKLVNNLFLEKYMKRLLETRNEYIKEYAENGKWRAFLQH